VKDEGKEASNSPAVAVQLHARQFGPVPLRETQTVPNIRKGQIGVGTRTSGRATACWSSRTTRPLNCHATTPLCGRQSNTVPSRVSPVGSWTS
jgi:hypothetical protein